jgi:RNA polymerase sigma-32 factor
MFNIATTSDTIGCDAFNRLLAFGKKQKMLSPAEEKTLIVAATQHGDQRARERLALAHLPLVIRSAKKLSGYGLPIGDLVAQGNVGLMRAIDKYELGGDARLATYASWWVRSEMTDFIVRNASMVRHATSASQRTLFYSLKRAKERLGIYHEGELSRSEAIAIAEATGTAPDQVVIADRRLSHGSDASLNSTMEGEGSDEPIITRLVCPSRNPEQELEHTNHAAWQSDVIERALSRLNERERQIVVARHMADDRKTLIALAAQLGVTSERVRQIERIAFQKLRSALRSSERSTGMRLLAA